jgi:hypothetical protein
MNRVRVREATVQFEPVVLDLPSTASEERLPVATAGVLILALSLFGWLAILGVARFIIG